MLNRVDGRKLATTGSAGLVFLVAGPHSVLSGPLLPQLFGIICRQLAPGQGSSVDHNTLRLEYKLFRASYFPTLSHWQMPEFKVRS